MYICEMLWLSWIQCSTCTLINITIFITLTLNLNYDPQLNHSFTLDLNSKVCRKLIFFSLQYITGIHIPYLDSYIFCQYILGSCKILSDLQHWWCFQSVSLLHRVALGDGFYLFVQDGQNQLSPIKVYKILQKNPYRYTPRFCMYRVYCLFVEPKLSLEWS